MEPTWDEGLENFRHAGEEFEQITRRTQEQQQSAEQKRIQEVAGQIRDETRRDRPARIETQVMIDGEPATASQAGQAVTGEADQDARERLTSESLQDARRQDEYRASEATPDGPRPQMR